VGILATGKEGLMTAISAEEGPGRTVDGGVGRGFEVVEVEGGGVGSLFRGGVWAGGGVMVERAAGFEAVRYWGLKMAAVGEIHCTMRVVLMDFRTSGGLRNVILHGHSKLITKSTQFTNSLSSIHLFQSPISPDPFFTNNHTSVS
jgi:hypothetical protein